MTTTSPLTWPLGLVTPGHSGLPGSNSGLSSSWLFSTWPDHGLFMRCGETSTQSPRRGLYLHTGEVTLHPRHCVYPVPDVLVLRGLEPAHGAPGVGVTPLPSVTWSLLTQTE